MKAKELMANDWVYDGSINIQVTSENIFDIYVGNWDEPKPIELSKEICLKNGWKHHATYKYEECSVEYLLLRKYDTTIEVTIVDNVISDIRFSYSISEDESSTLCKLSNPKIYVHELQHALGLCGLKDLADNFKV